MFIIIKKVLSLVHKQQQKIDKMTTTIYIFKEVEYSTFAELCNAYYAEKKYYPNGCSFQILNRLYYY